MQGCGMAAIAVMESRNTRFLLPPHFRVVCRRAAEFAAQETTTGPLHLGRAARAMRYIAAPGL